MSGLFHIPSTERTQYRINPLAEVVCQFNFAKLLEISSMLPVAFQRKVRGEYPLFSSQEMPSIHINISENGQAVSSSKSSKIYRFTSEDQKSHIHLGDEFIAIITNEYECWEKFRETASRIFGYFCESYEPSKLLRIALRYQNIIDRASYGLEDTPWSELLNAQLFPMLAHPQVPASAIASLNANVVLKLPNAQVNIRQALLTKDEGGDQVVLIDSDFFTTELENVTNDNAIERAETLHSYTGNLFRWCISDKLHSALGPLEADGPA